MYNPFNLNEKKILVAGASSGIGRQTAIECSKLGAEVFILGRNNSKLIETLSLMEPGKHKIFDCDITNNEDLDSLISQLPIINGFSNNIGINTTMSIKYINQKNLFEAINKNAVAPILLTQMLIKNKKIAKHASLVYTSSLSGQFNVHYGDVLNATSKGALNSFAKSAALDLASQGIRVNCVNPGVVATESAFRGTILTEKEMNEKQNFFPLKRFGQPFDIAMVIVYLLSDASSWITGVNFPIDGGYSLI